MNVIKNGQHLNLKSSLDRFIVSTCTNFFTTKINLKSSLDRFIELKAKENRSILLYLKSSLDRFIVVYNSRTDLGLYI